MLRLVPVRRRLGDRHHMADRLDSIQRPILVNGRHHRFALDGARVLTAFVNDAKIAISLLLGVWQHDANLIALEGSLIFGIVETSIGTDDFTACRQGQRARP
jgi:hypothetical protein